MCIPFDPAILFLGIYLKEIRQIMSQRCIYQKKKKKKSTLIRLFMIKNNWKLTNSPSQEIGWVFYGQSTHCDVVHFFNMVCRV